MDHVRLFKRGEGSACHSIFMHNLEHHYAYLSPSQRDAMAAVNTAASFEEIARRKTDRLFVVERNGTITGYFHFGKEGPHIRIKRVQLTQSGSGLLSKTIFPLVERYRKRWGCVGIMGDAAPHAVKRFSRVPGIVVGEQKTRTVSGRPVEFVSLQFVSPPRSPVRTRPRRTRRKN